MDSREIWEIVIGIGLLISVYILTRHFHAWRMARVYKAIVRDLQQKGALDSSSAVALPYSQPNLFRMGTRDYLPKMLQYMTANGMVGMTEDGRYYLLRSGATSQDLQGRS